MRFQIALGCLITFVSYFTIASAQFYDEQLKEALLSAATTQLRAGSHQPSLLFSFPWP